MTAPRDDAKRTQNDRLRAWLKSDVTVTLPGWALALGAAFALALLFVALD